MDEKNYLVMTRSQQGEFKNTTKDVAQIVASGNKTLVTFLSGKTFPYNNENVLFFENPEEINIDQSILILKNGRPISGGTALVFCRKYLVIPSKKLTIPMSEVEIIPNIAVNPETVQIIDYYRYIADFLHLESPATDYYYKKKLITIRDDAVLSNYINPEKQLKNYSTETIFPFGMNPSQQMAVTNALTSQLSIIQGPPGTGKTQTILNIIANLICQNKTIAVVAGNNEATHNIYEKLASAGFDFIAARLGNAKKQDTFFSQEHPLPDMSTWTLSAAELHQHKHNITSSTQLLSTLLELQHEQAKTQKAINNLALENQHFHRHFTVTPINPARWSLGNGWSTSTLMKFMAEIEQNSITAGVSLRQRMRWLFKFRIYRFTEIKNQSSNLFKGLSAEYYRKKNIELIQAKKIIDEKLANHCFDDVLKQYTSSSMALFKHHLSSSFGNRNSRITKVQPYACRNEFSDFIKRFPVVLSTTDSIINNKGDNELFDYLIVDEASQVNLLTGVLAMACAKNMIVVGDLKQIPHIPHKLLIASQPDLDLTFNIQPEYSYFTHSLLSSVNKLFSHRAPVTLLKEHYRCHPRIIDFCNKKYYNNQLVIMTSSNDDPFKIIRTAPGQHSCKTPDGKSIINFRELEVIKNEILDSNLMQVKPDTIDEKIGIVTPYRGQADNAKHIITDYHIKIDTAHKFQGQEKDVIVYSPAANWVDEFNDSPNLINVAVSRAKKQFIIVTSDKLLKQQGTNIGDLLRHMEYQSLDPCLFESKIVSIFDCLYNEYAPILHAFRQRLAKTSTFLSENLMATLLNDIFSEEQFASFAFQHNYPLHLLVNHYAKLNELEQRFSNNLRSHIDFLVFNKLDKSPVLAIEVDGYQYHALDTRQKQRDQLKDNILIKLGIPLLRFSTKGSGEEELIRKALHDIISINPDDHTKVI